MIDALQHLVEQLENEPSLLDPSQFRQRSEALDSLDVYLPDIPAAHVEISLHQRANAMRLRLEAANSKLYQSIRTEIQRGTTPHTLLQQIDSAPNAEGGQTIGMGYDYLDELVSGVLQLEAPDDEHIHREPEMVFYQPTPARHIFNMMARIPLTEADVFVDLGSGLGHVPLLVTICTRAHSIGIELEATYVERARECAHNLNLNRIEFIHQDARTANLSRGTVFYLYTPFTGSILGTVLNRLRYEAATRQIRICTYGPCTSIVAAETWLKPTTTPETDRIVIFHSKA